MFALRLVSLGMVGVVGVVRGRVIGLRERGRKRGRRAIVLGFLGLWGNIFGVIVRFWFCCSS